MEAYKAMQLGHKYKYLVFSLQKQGVDAANKTVWGWRIDQSRASSGAAPSAAAPAAPAAPAMPAMPATGGMAPMAASPAAPATAGAAPSGAHPRRTSGGADTGGNQEAWEELLAKLPADAGVFTLFDFREKASDGRIIDKLVLLKWCPDTVPVEQKMLMGSTYQCLKQKLSGLSKDVQAASPSGITYRDMHAQLGA
jgi:hypothetical protein